MCRVSALRRAHARRGGGLQFWQLGRSLAASRGTGNGRGMIGVAPEAELLSISVGFGATTSKPFSEQIVDALRWAVDEGATIINMSLTTNTLDWDPSWDEAFQYAFDHDVVVVVAAGTAGAGRPASERPPRSRVFLPSVGSTRRAGRATTPPRRASRSACPRRASVCSGCRPTARSVQWNGTSGAAPIVSGVAALVRAAHPELDANNVLNRLIRTAAPVPGAAAGQDPLYGYGLIDAEAAVSATNVPSVSSNPLGDLAEWVRLYRRADAPAPTGEPTTAPVEIPPLPPVDSAPRASSPCSRRATACCTGRFRSRAAPSPL